jgi:prefoldin subunit 5
VRYDELSPMLLNEMQQANAQRQAMQRQMHAMQGQLAALKQDNDQLRAALNKVLKTDERVAMR